MARGNGRANFCAARIESDEPVVNDAVADLCIATKGLIGVFRIFIADTVM